MIPVLQPRETDFIFYHDLLVPEADRDEEWKKEGRKVQKDNGKRRQWQKGKEALCLILSASFVTRAKIKPVNKRSGSCSVPNDGDLGLFVFPLHVILHDGTTYKIQVE